MNHTYRKRKSELLQFTENSRQWARGDAECIISLHFVAEKPKGGTVTKQELLFTATIPQGIFMRFLHENPGQWARNMTVRAYFCAFCCYEQRSCE